MAEVHVPLSYRVSSTRSRDAVLEGEYINLTDLLPPQLGPSPTPLPANHSPPAHHAFIQPHSLRRPILPRRLKRRTSTTIPQRQESPPPRPMAWPSTGSPPPLRDQHNRRPVPSRPNRRKHRRAHLPNRRIPNWNRSIRHCHSHRWTSSRPIPD